MYAVNERKWNKLQRENERGRNVCLRSLKILVRGSVKNLFIAGHGTT